MRLPVINSHWQRAFSFSWRWRIVAAAVGLVVCTGCGARSDRLPISGEVTLDGTPLDSGAIRFTSIGGEKVLATGAIIQNGEFDVPADKGLPPGTYHLEITSPDEAAQPVMVRGPQGERGIPTQPERIPPEYNFQSNKTVDVKADADNHFKFEIVSRKAN
jgi:hypothetical protein